MAEEFDSGLSWWSNIGSTTSSTATITSFDDSSLQYPDFDMDWNQSLLTRSTSGRADQPIFNAMLQNPDFDMDWNQSLLTRSTSGRADQPIFNAMLQNPDFDMDWNQSLLTRSTSGRADQPIFNAMLQEPLNYHHHQQQLPHHFGRQNMIMNNSQQLLGLQGGQSEPQQPIFDARSTDCVAGHGCYHGSSSDSVPKLPEFFKSSSPSFQQSSSCNNSQFSKNTTFWPSVQFGARSYEQKPSCTKLNSDGTQKKNGGGGGGSSSSSGQSALKKARIESPTPLPVFKARKEKLGDRVTALQQLVSPFGKTDTASVLHEAIEYIKFLHEQVGVLTTPYLKNGHPMQGQQRSNRSRDGEGEKQNLKSRGLCLVPIEITYPVAGETATDFSTPTFGGTYR